MIAPCDALGFGLHNVEHSSPHTRGRGCRRILVIHSESTQCHMMHTRTRVSPSPPPFPFTLHRHAERAVQCNHPRLRLRYRQNNVIDLNCSNCLQLAYSKHARRHERRGLSAALAHGNRRHRFCVRAHTFGRVCVFRQCGIFINSTSYIMQSHSASASAHI